MTARLVTRTGGLDRIEPLATLRGGRLQLHRASARPWFDCPPRAPGERDHAGVWVPDSVARSMGVCPGDRLAIEGVRRARVTVAGIYRNLVTVYPARFWQSLAGEYVPEGAPPFLLTDRATFRAVAERLHDRGEIRWEFPVQGRRLTLPDAIVLAHSLRSVIDRLGMDRSQALFSGAQADSLLLGVARLSERMVGATRPPVNLLALAGTLLALAGTAAAGLYGVQRRKVEFNLLVTRGIGPVVLGARASLEAAGPALVGSALGLASCVSLVKLLGPSSLLETEAITTGLAHSLWATAGGVVLLGIATGAASARDMSPHRIRSRRTARSVPWDVALLALSYVFYRQINAREELVASAGGAPEIDVLVLIFPILFIAGATGVATRGLRALLPRLRVTGGTLAPPLFLASRRLASASRIGLVLVTIAALSVGIFVYAGTLVTSGRATVDGKARVFIGSDVSVPLPPSPGLPDIPFEATVVRKIDGARVMPNLITADVLGVDPATFAQVAFWDDSFSNAPLPELLSAIAVDGARPAQPLPALVVGGTLGDEAKLETGAVSSPLDIVARPRVFPGMAPQRPLVVVDRRALDPEGGPGAVVGSAGVQELWVKGEPNRVVPALVRERLPLAAALTLYDVRDAASLLPSEWTFGFLQALGAAAGLIALVGMLLYLQARQRSRVVANSLARRMGLTSRAHARAIGVELAAMLTVAYGLGSALAGVAADLVYTRVDPLPSVPPEPLLRAPVTTVVLVALVLGVATVIGAWRVQRSADRTNVAEVMRLAH